MQRDAPIAAVAQSYIHIKLRNCVVTAFQWALGFWYDQTCWPAVCESVTLRSVEILYDVQIGM